MRTLKTLIDEAAALCYGQSALARKLGVHPNVVHEWKVGKRAVTPETVAELCDLLELDGEEARRLAAVAVAENPKNARKAHVIRRAFFVCWALGVGLTLQAGDAQARIKAAYADGYAVVRTNIGAVWKLLLRALDKTKAALRTRATMVPDRGQTRARHPSPRASLRW